MKKISWLEARGCGAIIGNVRNDEELYIKRKSCQQRLSSTVLETNKSIGGEKVEGRLIESFNKLEEIEVLLSEWIIAEIYLKRFDFDSSAVFVLLQ